MVVARSGGYRARRQQQRQTPGAMGGRPGAVDAGCGSFGDNYNDLSMLEAAGTGVAMGNAVDEVKARANMVIGDNESTSIAEFIYRQLL